MEAVGRKVGVVGERVGVAVAKKGVVVEVVVAEVGLVVVVVDAENWEVPEETIWWVVAQTKTGRPIVSFARVSISFSLSVSLQLSLKSYLSI